jgi:hypothetical protein
MQKRRRIPRSCLKAVGACESGRWEYGLPNTPHVDEDRLRAALWS